MQCSTAWLSLLRRKWKAIFLQHVKQKQKQKISQQMLYLLTCHRKVHFVIAHSRKRRTFFEQIVSTSFIRVVLYDCEIYARARIYRSGYLENRVWANPSIMIRNSLASLGGKAQFSSVPCPLCRTPITLIDLEKLAASQDETNDVEEFVFTEEIRQAQRERSQVYERQKAQGGLVPKKGENEVVFVLESRFDSEGREIQRAPRPAPPEQRAVRDDDAIRSQGSRKDARNGNPGPEHGMKLKGNHHKQKTKTSRNPDSQIEPLVSEGGGGGGRGRARGRGRGRQGNRGRGRGGRAGRKDGATGTAPQEA
eukprot:m.137953 g.137953  ORF g.137953 m.137953 type:complete len:308 (+) comp14766_c0_seq19:337-1260(+)